ncbi:hypothetical protein BMF94_2103 [Rhodotorula taiwanensis]|uniref:Ysc84 actin-binding domain-containing protein n=1 Tax=Rhodotorula taiwanensis TaxID=741276 RepID=A0A2S5BDI7_9BASI|nr:hypothetical protein BMF94_2103 [Rhodotorula taiwanensis]
MSSGAPPPPPRRSAALNASSSGTTTPKNGTSSGGWKGKASAWGNKAFDKAIKLSDKVAPYANNLTEKVGGERWWPSSDDFPLEVAKCTRILRAFTVDGVAQTVEEKDETGVKRKRKAFRKIPAEVLRAAKGIVVYTSMRSGIAPLGGSGGTGLICARLSDGSWSAPSCVAPAHDTGHPSGNFAGGLLLGLDIFDAILLIMTDESLQAFMTHKVSLGGELAVAAGTYGAGALGEIGIEKTPIISYQRSRGFYAGVEAVAQAYLTRFDENERVYSLMGVTQRDILTGHVKPTSDAHPFLAALREAETGFAQRALGAENQYEQAFESNTVETGADPLTHEAEEHAALVAQVTEPDEKRANTAVPSAGATSSALAPLPPPPRRNVVPPPPPSYDAALIPDTPAPAPLNTVPVTVHAVEPESVTATGSTPAVTMTEDVK